MVKRQKAGGIVILLILVLSTGLVILGLRALLPSLLPLSVVSPSAPIIFDPSPTQFSFKSNIMVNPSNGHGTINSYTCTTGTGSGIPNNQACFEGSTNYPPNILTSSSDTVVHTDTGIFFRQWGESAGIFGCPITLGCSVTWNVAMPSGLPNAPPGQSNSGCEIAPYPSTLCLPPTPDPYSSTVGITGSGFVPVNQTSKEGAAFPTPFVNPYPIKLTYTSWKIVTNSTGTWNATTTVTRTLYVGRYLFTVNLSAPAGNGASGLFTITCGESGFILPSGCTNDTPGSDLNAGFSAMLPDLNNIAKLSNSKIALQVNVPASWIQTNLDWYGGYGAWIGFGTSLLGDCATSGCSTGLADHAALGIYSDPALTQGAFPVASAYQSVNSYTAAQICSIIGSPAYCGSSTVGSGGPCSAGLPCTFYVPLNIQSFGDTFAVGQTCSGTQLAACFTTGGAVFNVPIIVDIIGSAVPAFVTSYVVVTNPNGNTGVSGKVYDGASFLCGIGLCGPLAGVTVSDGPPCNSQGCSTLETTTAPDGSYSLTGLNPQTGHQIYFTRPGYQTGVISGVTVAQGQTVPLPSVTLLPGVGTGSLCLIPPVYSGVPGAPPIFGGFCQPTWLVVLEIFVAVGLIAFTIFLAVPSQRRAGFSAGKFKGSL